MTHPPNKPTQQLLSHDDLKPYGFEQPESSADGVFRAMVNRLKVGYLRELQEQEAVDLRRRSAERRSYPASIKGFPLTPQKLSTIDEDSGKKYVKCRKHYCHFSERREDDKGSYYQFCKVKYGLCRPANCDTQNQTDLDRSQRFDYYPLIKKDFTIPGMGESGSSCCSVDSDRISGFSTDFKHVKVTRIICKRVGCPRCYRLWIKTRAFEITLAAEVASLLRGERPFSVVFSVRPKDIYFARWTWDSVNQSLFNRGYRRGSKIGIDGGFVFYHPFRVRKGMKKRLRRYRKTLHGEERRLSDGDVGFWRMIRKDVMGYGDFYKYVKVGPHLHGVCFGDPGKHRDPGYFIGVQQEEVGGRLTGRPLRLRRTADVVGKVMYLLTHCGVSTLNKIIQPTRRYGCMYDFQIKQSKQDDGSIVYKLLKLPEDRTWQIYDPEWVSWFENEWIPGKCKEIADLIDMSWSDDGGLVMKTDKSDKDIVWLPIWKIYHCIHEIRERVDLPFELVCFYESLMDYLEKYGTPPPTLPHEKICGSSLYWAAGYLTGLDIPKCVDSVRDDEGVEPEAVVNQVKSNRDVMTPYEEFEMLSRMRMRGVLNVVE